MRALLGTLDSSSRTVSYLMGGLAVALAVAVIMTSSSVVDIANWAREVLGWSFVVMLTSLVFLALYSWVRMLQLKGCRRRGLVRGRCPGGQRRDHAGADLHAAGLSASVSARWPVRT